MRNSCQGRCHGQTAKFVAGQWLATFQTHFFTGNKTRFCVWALALTLAACTDATEGPERITIHSGLGGSAPISQAIYRGIEDSGKPVVVDGHLHSTDAYFALALPDVCYTERASFSLHAISYLLLWPSRKHTDRMTNRLPEPIAEWFRGQMAYHDPIGWATLGGEELSEVWPEGAC